MLNPLKWNYENQVGLLVSTLTGAGCVVVIGYQSGNEWPGTLIWALVSPVIVTAIDGALKPRRGIPHAQ